MDVSEYFWLQITENPTQIGLNNMHIVLFTWLEAWMSISEPITDKVDKVAFKLDSHGA